MQGKNYFLVVKADPKTYQGDVDLDLEGNVFGFTVTNKDDCLYDHLAGALKRKFGAQFPSDPVDLQRDIEETGRDDIELIPIDHLGKISVIFGMLLPDMP